MVRSFPKAAGVMGMGIGDPVQAYCTATRLTYVKQFTMEDFY